MKRAGKSMVLGWRGLLLTLAFTVFAGYYTLANPIDRIIEGSVGRFAWRAVSGETVVVGIDEKTTATITDESQTIPLHADVINAVNAAGAKRLFVDFTYDARVNDPSFGQLTDAVQRMGSRVIMGVMAAKYEDDNVVVERWPADQFGDKAQIACLCWEYYFWQVWDIPTAVNVEGKILPSFAAIMAELPVSEVSRVPIDYSYDTDTIVNYSAIDVVSGHIPANALKNKDVIFATLGATSPDRHHFPGHDLVAGAHIHLFAGETLKRGIPKVYGWIPPLMAAALAIGILLARNLTRSFLLFSSAIALALTAAKILLAQALIHFSIGPALLFISITAFIVTRNRGRRSAQDKNAVSGLPNFNAMRSGQNFGSDTLVAGKIVNFDDFVTFLSPDESQRLVQQVARRLQLPSTGQSLHHDVDGIFAWRVPVTQRANLEEQLAGLAALFHSPLMIDDRRIDVSIAFGINDQIDDSNSQRLAAARGAAERAIRNRTLFEHYAVEERDDATWKLSFHSQLEDALASGDIWVAYQPQYDLKSGQMIGVEALARWTHPTRGTIPPDKFIVQAEQSQDIYRLTLFVMDRAIQSGSELCQLRPNMAISVNLSAALLDQPDLASTIKIMLRAHRLPASQLTIEITETAQFENSPHAMQTLTNLREAGVRLSVDDYGTGQSNLEYLIRIEADEIKIDKQFINTMRESQRNFEIVKSTIELAHRLGASAVAEGIEDQATLSLLEKLGCDIGQGYYLGKPQLFFEILASLSDSNHQQTA